MEFLLAAVPVLLLGLGSIEAIHWYFVRQAVSLALAQAARAAITQHADPVALDNAFRQALLPLHAGPTPMASQERLKRAIDRRERATGLPAWRIAIVSPSAAVFHDFASGDLELPRPGFAVIDNDFLHERHQARLAQGWPEGRGPLSGQTTLEANTLSLHLTWLHEPLLPGVRQLFRQLAPSDSRYGPLAMAGAGYLPIQRRLSFVMQSHPVAWNMPAHGRVVRLTHPAQDPGRSTEPAGQPTTSEPMDDARPPGVTELPAFPPPPAHPVPPAFTQRETCTGMWCLDSFNDGSDQNVTDTSTVASPGNASAPPGNSGDYLDGEVGRDAGTAAPVAPPAADDCPDCC